MLYQISILEIDEYFMEKENAKASFLQSVNDVRTIEILSIPNIPLFILVFIHDKFYGRMNDHVTAHNSTTLSHINHILSCVLYVILVSNDINWFFAGTTLKPWIKYSIYVLRVIT